MDITCNFGMTLEEFKAIPVKTKDDPEIMSDFDKVRNITEIETIKDKRTGLDIKILETEIEMREDSKGLHRHPISNHIKDFSYYKDGKLYKIRESFIEKGTTHKIYQTFFYDDEDRVISEVTEDSEGTVIKSYCYRLDSNGNSEAGMHTEFYPNNKEEENGD